MGHRKFVSKGFHIRCRQKNRGPGIRYNRFLITHLEDHGRQSRETVEAGLRSLRKITWSTVSKAGTKMSTFPDLEREKFPFKKARSHRKWQSSLQSLIFIAGSGREKGCRDCNVGNSMLRTVTALGTRCLQLGKRNLPNRGCCSCAARSVESPHYWASELPASLGMIVKSSTTEAVLQSNAYIHVLLAAKCAKSVQTFKSAQLFSCCKRPTASKNLPPKSYVHQILNQADDQCRKNRASQLTRQTTLYCCITKTASRCIHPSKAPLTTEPRFSTRRKRLDHCPSDSLQIQMDYQEERRSQPTVGLKVASGPGRSGYRFSG